MTDALLGMPVVVMPCMTEFHRWRRTNRNNRIARKWRKHYGAETRCGLLASGKVYRIDNFMVACRCVIERIKEQLK